MRKFVRLLCRTNRVSLVLLLNLGVGEFFYLTCLDMKLYWRVFE